MKVIQQVVRSEQYDLPLSDGSEVRTRNFITVYLDPKEFPEGTNVQAMIRRFDELVSV